MDVKNKRVLCPVCQELFRLGGYFSHIATKKHQRLKKYYQEPEKIIIQPKFPLNF